MLAECVSVPEGREMYLEVAEVHESFEDEAIWEEDRVLSGSQASHI